jgi:hypothetical protein
MSKFFTIALLILIVSCSSGNDNGSVGSLKNNSDDSETRTTKDGYVFTRDTSNPQLGEAWRDPLGTIWGDVVKNDDGSIASFTLGEATEYCGKINAEVPENGSFGRLMDYFGRITVGAEAGYEPQVLPNLSQTLTEGTVVSNHVWSSSLGGVYWNYYFDGLTGRVLLHYQSSGLRLKLRCVVNPLVGKTFKERGLANPDENLIFVDSSHFKRNSLAWNQWKEGTYTVHGYTLSIRSEDGTMEQYYTLSEDGSRLFYGRSDQVAYTLVK